MAAASAASPTRKKVGVLSHDSWFVRRLNEPTTRTADYIGLQFTEWKDYRPTPDTWLLIVTERYLTEWKKGEEFSPWILSARVDPLNSTVWVINNHASSISKVDVYGKAAYQLSTCELEEARVAFEKTLTAPPPPKPTHPFFAKFAKIVN